MVPNNPISKQNVIYRTIFIMIALTAITFMGTYHHEDTHKQIYKNYGCQDIRIEYGLFKSTTYCDEWKNTTTQQEWEQSRFLQSQAEIVGYASFPILYALMIILIVLVFEPTWRKPV